MLLGCCDLQDRNAGGKGEPGHRTSVVRRWNVAMVIGWRLASGLFDRLAQRTGSARAPVLRVDVFAHALLLHHTTASLRSFLGFQSTFLHFLRFASYYRLRPQVCSPSNSVPHMCCAGCPHHCSWPACMHVGVASPSQVLQVPVKRIDGMCHCSWQPSMMPSHLMLECEAFRAYTCWSLQVSVATAPHHWWQHAGRVILQERLMVLGSNEAKGRALAARRALRLAHEGLYMRQRSVAGRVLLLLTGRLRSQRRALSELEACLTDDEAALFRWWAWAKRKRRHHGLVRLAGPINAAAHAITRHLQMAPACIARSHGLGPEQGPQWLAVCQCQQGFVHMILGVLQIAAVDKHCCQACKSCRISAGEVLLCSERAAGVHSCMPRADVLAPVSDGAQITTCAAHAVTHAVIAQGAAVGEDLRKGMVSVDAVLLAQGVVRQKRTRPLRAQLQLQCPKVAITFENSKLLPGLPDGASATQLVVAARQLHCTVLAGSQESQLQSGAGPLSLEVRRQQHSSSSLQASKSACCIAASPSTCHTLVVASACSLADLCSSKTRLHPSSDCV